MGHGEPPQLWTSVLNAHADGKPSPLRCKNICLVALMNHLQDHHPQDLAKTLV